MSSAPCASAFKPLAHSLTVWALVLCVSPATAVEVYDSGWAVGSPQTPANSPSVLGPSGVRVDRVLPKRVLENLQLPAMSAEPTDGLRWRPVRTARRPENAAAPADYPPLPLDKTRTRKPLDEAFRVSQAPDGQAAPESQALPEDTARLAPPDAPSRHQPAPFVANTAKPLTEEPTEDEAAATATPDSSPAGESQAEAHPSRNEPESKETEAPDVVVIEDKAAESAKPAEAPQQKKSAARATPKTFDTPKEIEKPQRELPPLTRNQMYLRRKMRSVLSYYYRRPLNNVDHDAWEVMHSMLSYGLYSRVQDGGRRGRPVTAIGYLCFNKPCQRHQMFYLTPEGNLDVRVGVGLQGHKGQLLAMLAQCNVSPDYPIKVDGQDFTIRDLIAAEQLTCYERSELTFKLIGLMHYLPSDSTWVNDQGESWDFPKLIADERTQKIRGAACGGTHRLSGLTLAVKRRAARGEPVDGEWLEAQKFVQEYQNYAFRLQNRDGSLSTEWFRGPGAEDDIDRRIRTTGHTLEWLIYSLEDEELNDARVVRAVNYLTNLIMSNTNNGWEVGPLSHALHALLLYDQRMFQPYDNADDAKIAGKKGNKPAGLSYEDLGSTISESYSYVQARHEERVARESSGFGGLFGIGSSRRHSR